MGREYDTKVKYDAGFLRCMRTDELFDLQESAAATLHAMRTEAQMCPPDKPHLFRKVRSDIARIKTILRQG